LERDNPEKEAGKEFGFFIQTANGQRREYTIWMDVNGSMHLHIRENGEITFNEIILIVNEDNLKIKGTFPRLYAEFPIKIFFEIDNNGLDIIYLQQGLVQQAANAEELDPTQMLPIINNTIRPTLGEIEAIGLIGYGGETQTIIWPLAFYDKRTTQATSTNTPVPTPTKIIISTSTETILGIGYVNKAVASTWSDPNRTLIERLSLNHPLIIMERREVSGSTWYRCRWENNGNTQEGWILAEYVTLGTPPP
jgi:hypothetical protein